MKVCCFTERTAYPIVAVRIVGMQTEIRTFVTLSHRDLVSRLDA